MNNLLYMKLRRNLMEDFQSYETLREHFESFCKAAQQLIEAGTGIQGLKAKTDDHALILEFIDRRIRVTMRRDRKAKMGALYVKDVSNRRPDDKPMFVTAIPFDHRSETELAGGMHADKLHLTVPHDAVALALLIVNTALDKDPWK